MSDHNRISPYNINTVSSTQVMGIRNTSVREVLTDPITNSLNYHHKNCMADSEENYYQDLGCERVNLLTSSTTIS